MVEAKVYEVGPLTMSEIFRPHGIENVSDWQAVLDATEKALQEIYDGVQTALRKIDALDVYHNS